MIVCKTIASLREALSAYARPVLVPTMGNLHEGHLALIRQGKPLGDVITASIFVNRLQFGPHDDFDQYPRTFESDCAKLESAGCDVVFAPSEKEFYPQPQTFKVHPPAALAEILEGHFRPGFYIGVSTVVMKLFTTVQPRVAIFGEKDYQQLMVIRNMVQQFALPIEIIGGKTVRATDGLALSSRNGYLSASERAQAPQLNAALRHAIEKARRGVAIAQCESEAMAALAAQGWKPDYLVLRYRSDLSEIPAAQISTISGHCVALAAARCGATRLIDQLEF